jgi:hypothetical protein
MTIGYRADARKITWEKLRGNEEYIGNTMRTDTAYMIEKDFASAMQDIRVRSQYLSSRLSHGTSSMRSTYYLPREQTDTTICSTINVPRDLEDCTYYVGSIGDFTCSLQLIFSCRQSVKDMLNKRKEDLIAGQPLEFSVQDLVELSSFRLIHTSPGWSPTNVDQYRINVTFAGEAEYVDKIWQKIKSILGGEELRLTPEDLKYIALLQFIHDTARRKSRTFIRKLVIHSKLKNCLSDHSNASDDKVYNCNPYDDHDRVRSHYTKQTDDPIDGWICKCDINDDWPNYPQ